MQDVRDPQRIDKVLDAIRRAWKQSPDLRFGQLVVNMLRPAGRPAEPCPGVFYMEDEEVLEQLLRASGCMHRMVVARRIVLPDAGPLFQLACRGALDRLLHAGDRIVLTDVAELQVMRRSDELAGTTAVKDFLACSRDRIEILPTALGSLAVAELKRGPAEGKGGSLAKDLGELAIASFVIALRDVPVAPTLVIVEDAWFDRWTYAVPDNVRMLSTSAWLDELEGQCSDGS